MNPNDSFGMSTSIDADTITIGAYREESNQTTITNGANASADNSFFMGQAGAVYVFKRVGTNWSQEAYLKPSNLDSMDNFGFTASIHGNMAVVGSRSESSNQTTITNGTHSSSDNSANSSGAAYVFKRTGVLWAQEAYLKSPNSESVDCFGTRVSINGNTIVVGAPYEDSNQTTISNGTTASADNSFSMSGAAYVFFRQ